MKINRIVKVICALAILAIITSCKKEKSFPLKIVNQTNYDIIDIDFSGTVSGESISVQNNSESETVILSYPRRFRTQPKRIYAYIDSFDDQGNSFSFVELGNDLPFSHREINETDNTIFLTCSEVQDTLRFLFSFE